VRVPGENKYDALQVEAIFARSALRLARCAGSMAGVAQLVEHWIVAPVVAGSIPVARPILLQGR
jgi:hypothetical protein